MNETSQIPVQELSPDQLMTGFSKSRMGTSTVASIVFHVVAIGVLSIPMLFASAQKPQTPTDRPPNPAVQNGENGQAGSENGEPTHGDEPDGDGGNGAADDQNGDNDQNGQDDLTPVEQRTSEVADPDDIPNDPDLDLPIE